MFNIDLLRLRFTIKTLVKLKSFQTVFSVDLMIFEKYGKKEISIGLLLLSLIDLKKFGISS